MAGKKLKTETFESVTKFFKAPLRTRMTVCLNPWSSSISRNALTSSSKTSFAIRFVHAKTSLVLTKQDSRLLHAMPDAALTTIARSSVGTSTVIATAIALMTANIKQQSALVSSTPALATGKMTAITIRLKSQAMKSPRATAIYRAPSTSSQTNWQSTCGLTVLRTRPTRRSWPHKRG